VKDWCLADTHCGADYFIFLSVAVMFYGRYTCIGCTLHDYGLFYFRLLIFQGTVSSQYIFSIIYQAHSMVYMGSEIMDQSPKFCLRSGSKDCDRISQRWNWGSSIKFVGSFTGPGITSSLKSGIRDQNYLKIAGS